MMVNNNCYTNVLAKKIFNNAIKVINEMKECRPEVINALMEKIGVTDENIAEWQKMADNMRIPYNKETDIYEQNDGFFDYPHIDVKNIPHTMFPIYHHWSYDSIFRYDMIKQPDVLLLPFFFSTEYSMETKRLNYEYYEPRCSHESSLSPCIHSILASELGKHDEAHEYAGFASRLDLDDYNRNTREGLHVTSLAGAWLNIVYGFGGLRSDGAKLAFYPSIPKGWNSFSFNILYRGSRLNITISRKSAIFKVTEGSPVPVIVFEKEYTADEKGVEIDMPADRLG
jgi:maltose phosphorylase